MKLAVIADSHFDEHSRFDECKRIHSWIAKDAEARGCTAWLHAGDVFERRSTPAERLAVADWVEEMRSRVGPGIIVRGNHDALGDLPLFERLHGTPVTVVEDARVVDLYGARIACMAWPNRGRIAALSPDSKLDTWIDDALRNVLRGLGAQRPDLFLGHCMARGSITSTGQPLVGHDLEVGLEDLALVGADAYLIGHVHKGQQWEISGAPCVYPGSPRRANFGEIEPKGYVVVEMDGRRIGSDWVASTEFVETPATRMLHFEAEWQDGDLRADWAEFDGQAPHAEIRFRYTCTSENREAAAARASERADSWRARGAVHVKVEEVLDVQTRARVPEVARATSLIDKLDAFWESKRVDVTARRQQLHEKATAIETRLRA